MPAAEAEPDRHQDLVNRLASHDVRYLGGDGLDGESAPVAPLLVDLAQSPSSRLRSALVALLLRHPEYAAPAERAARELPLDDPARHVLLLGIAVAAALQTEWSFSLDLYLPQQQRIQADRLAAELELPSPQLDFGRTCLAAAARLQGKDDPFPVNYEADWENAARRLHPSAGRLGGAQPLHRSLRPARRVHLRSDLDRLI